MATCMHLAGVLGFIVDVVCLLDIQRIHIGAKSDGRAVTPVTFQRADHAGARQPAMHGDTEFVQPQRHVIGCFVLLEGGFRVLVDMVPPLCHFSREFGDTVVDRHVHILWLGTGNIACF